MPFGRLRVFFSKRFFYTSTSVKRYARWVRPKLFITITLVGVARALTFPTPRSFDESIITLPTVPYDLSPF